MALIKLTWSKKESFVCEALFLLEIFKISLSCNILAYLFLQCNGPIVLSTRKFESNAKGLELNPEGQAAKVAKHA